MAALEASNQLMLPDTERELAQFTLEEAVRYIVDASVKLKCSFLTRCKALLIYHHFKRCVHETNYDPPIIAAASLSLSIKYNEEPIEFNSIILVLFYIIEQDSHVSMEDAKFKGIKRSVALMECLILRMIEFSSTYALAHEYLAYFMNDIREEVTAIDAWHVFAESCIRIASDFYLTKRCLNYKAEDIASTIIQVSLYLIGTDINDERSHLQNWLKALNDCPEERRQDIIKDIFLICDVGPFAENHCRKENHLKIN